MKPTDFIHTGAEPTIPRIIADALSFGADRVSLVSGADNYKFIAIFLLSNAAVRAAGPFLRDHVAKLTQHEPERVLQFDAQTTPLGRIVDVMKEQGLEWSYQAVSLAKGIAGAGLVVFIQGESITEQFAADLTARGVITNLK